MTQTPNMAGIAVRTRAVTVELVDVRAGVRLRGHGHDVPHLCYLSSGAFAERDRGRERAVAAGTLRSSPAGDEHRIAFGADSRCLLILRHGARADDGPDAAPGRRFVRGEHVARLAAALERALARMPHESPLAIESLALELAAGAGRTGRPGAEPPAWLARIRERLWDDPLAGADATELAREAGYHPVYVARAYRRAYGMGLGESARLARAERARAAIGASRESLASIAAGCGYADQSHMTRALRWAFGVTPAAVRMRNGRVAQVSSFQDGQVQAV